MGSNGSQRSACCWPPCHGVDPPFFGCGVKSGVPVIVSAVCGSFHQGAAPLLASLQRGACCTRAPQGNAVRDVSPWGPCLRGFRCAMDGVAGLAASHGVAACQCIAASLRPFRISGYAHTHQHARHVRLPRVVYFMLLRTVGSLVRLVQLHVPTTLQYLLPSLCSTETQPSRWHACVVFMYVVFIPYQTFLLAARHFALVALLSGWPAGII